MAPGARPRIAYLSYSTGEFDARTFRMAEFRHRLQLGGHRLRALASGPCRDRAAGRVSAGPAPSEWRYLVPGLCRIAADDIGRPSQRMASGPRRLHQSERTRAARSRFRFRPLERWHWWQRIREFPLQPMGGRSPSTMSSNRPTSGTGCGRARCLRWPGCAGDRRPDDLRQPRHLHAFAEIRRLGRRGRPPGMGRASLGAQGRPGPDRQRRVRRPAPGPVACLATGHRDEPPRDVDAPFAEAGPHPRGPGPARARPGSCSTRDPDHERGIEQTDGGDPRGAVGSARADGFGPLEKGLADAVSRPPYLGRVLLLPPSRRPISCAGAPRPTLVMAIQPTTLNHRYTTPQKLFESFAAGVPVVASDLPGMAPIVRATGAGVLCDPTSPMHIAEAIHRS